ncbi:hypothetical protein IFM12275_50560 [Nocardia sputorum]|nr:hypothetical protein IFM12275_50560 [Nocardia sputorum]
MRFEHSPRPRHMAAIHRMYSADPHRRPDTSDHLLHAFTRATSIIAPQRNDRDARGARKRPRGGPGTDHPDARAGTATRHDRVIMFRSIRARVRVAGQAQTRLSSSV